MMTVAQLKEWLMANRIPDDFDLFVVRFGRDGTSMDDIEGIKVNSGGTSVQLEVYPEAWRPVSEGTTRVRPAGSAGSSKEGRMSAKRYETIWRNKWLTAQATSLGEMASMLEAAAGELREMAAAGVELDTQGMGDDYAFLYTSDPAVADRFGFHEEESGEEDEDCEDEEVDE